MVKAITSTMVAEALRSKLADLAYRLPTDVETALQLAYETETNPRGRTVLGHLIENARIAREDSVPLCQDTGIVWVCLELGPDYSVAGDVFSSVDAVVADVYERGGLRKSVVKDAFFDRVNTGNNTPAFCELKLSPTVGKAKLHIMLKGGGSDNASRVCMLTPGSGKAGIFNEVMACVQEKAPNACPPLIVGIGIGSTFDKVANLAKQALMRPLDETSSDIRTATLESELLEAVNSSGIGPGGLGGLNTALGVKVNTAPCHIAALPLAINLGCSAMRRCTIEL